MCRVEACRGAVTLHGDYATDRTSLFSDIVEEPQTSTILSLQNHQKHIRHEVRPHEFASQVCPKSLVLRCQWLKRPQLRTGRWTRRQAGAVSLGEVFVPLGHLSFADASGLVFFPGQRIAWKD